MSSYAHALAIQKIIEREKKTVSRIILTKHNNGDDHIVVGWDRAQQTFYWQEFAREPRMYYSEEMGKWKIDSPVHKVRVYDTKVEAQDHQWDDWEEMLGYGGYNDGELPEVSDMIGHAMLNGSDKVGEVIADFSDQGSLEPLLKEHQQLPSPASNIIVDLSKRDL